MSKFNKLFKHIILENNLSVPAGFPESFDYADTGLEFIFDIMPTFGPQYQWHTVEDLQAIPELVAVLQDSPKDVVMNIADGFNDAADAEENEYIDEEMQQPQNFREIAKWLQSLPINGNIPIRNTVDMLEENNDELNIHDHSCFNTVPTVVKETLLKEAHTRAYRRGLKALSLANRKKFNQEHLNELQNTNVENPTIKTDTITTKLVSQQPVSKSTILPVKGVDRPVKVNSSEVKVKTNFMNNVYIPSITDLTNEAKKRSKARLIKEKAKLVQEDTNDLEFTTNYTTNTEPSKQMLIKQDNSLNKPIKKELCIICKEYVAPAQKISASGKTYFECPKCGLRITKGNMLK